MPDRDLITLIRRIIVKETMYQRIYKGRVSDLNDPLGKARVLVTVFDIGFTTPDKGFWCSPSDKNSVSTLKLQDWTNVFFEAGDRNRPKCFGQATGMKDQLPSAYDGNPDTHVLFEEPSGKQKIVYDAQGDVLKIGKGNEAILKGNDFISTIATWVPVPADGGASLKLVLTAALLSTKVKVE